LRVGRRLEQREIALSSRNRDARGIWGGGTALWVLNANPSLFVYDLASGELIGEYALAAANTDPRGLWSDGVTLWVSDHAAKQLFAYRLPAPPAAAPARDAPGQGQAEEPIPLDRVPGEDFTGLTAAGNLSPRGIWSDGEVMYVADANDGRVYSYNMPDAIDARLASLDLSNVVFGAFSPAVGEYRGVSHQGAATTTVSATAMQAGASVAIEPPDADGNTRNGHQVALQGLDEISVTVTSADGSRTRAYRVRFAETQCLRGAVAAGFSLVVSEGGGVDELEACARTRSVGALYALHEGAYISYILGAPAFVNRPFHELFADGVPAFTPLIVSSEGPPSADPAASADPGLPWAQCLRGAVAPGFSAVVYEGGSVEHLAACALGRNVTALYVLDGGDWISYILGAPEFVNRPFRELFPGGVPAVTPLIVSSPETPVATTGGAAAGATAAASPAGTGDDTPARTSASGEAAAAEQQPRLVIGNTGGVGVSHRNDCADAARLPRFGWHDGTVVEVVSEGQGRCAGWLSVRAADGVTSWVREQYLVPV
ncbi:MAG: hypothetical protein F4Y57_01665, partial [Acidobacteria bacterium]|nr:hypothetical protein [Acidobacteriota bacterium]